MQSLLHPQNSVAAHLYNEPNPKAKETCFLLFCFLLFFFFLLSSLLPLPSFLFLFPLVCFFYAPEQVCALVLMLGVFLHWC